MGRRGGGGGGLSDKATGVGRGSDDSLGGKCWVFFSGAFFC